MFTCFFVLAFISCASAQTITKLQWSICGPGVIDFYNFDATPMVSFIHLSNVYFYY